MAALTAAPVRLVAFFHKVAGITDEELCKVWLHEVGPIFASLDIVKKNVHSYQQCRIDQAALQKLLNQGFQRPEWDGFAVLEGESFDKLNEVFASDEWQSRVGPVEGRVIDIATPKLVPCSKVEAFGTKRDANNRSEFVRFAVLDGKRPETSVENTFEWMLPLSETDAPIGFLDTDSFDTDVKGLGSVILPVRVAPIVG